jgi:uncharacterized protein YkwD
MLRRLTLAGALAALATLAACSDSPVAPNAASPTSPQYAKGGNKGGGTTTSGTPVTITACDGSSLTLNADEYRTLVLHNQTRAQKGLTLFCVHPLLETAARAHSQEMIDKQYFAHNSYNGDPFYVRWQSFGYIASSGGENIAYGSGTSGLPDPIYSAWLASSGHFANIVTPQFSQVGIGVVIGTFQGVTNTRMYTVDFAQPWVP